MCGAKPAQDMADSEKAACRPDCHAGWTVGIASDYQLVQFYCEVVNTLLLKLNPRKV